MLDSSRAQDRSTFELIAANVMGRPDAGVGIAASRWGATGVVNLEGIEDVVVARHAAARLLQFGRGRLGVKLDAADPQADAIAAFGAALPDQINLLILTAASSPR